MNNGVGVTGVAPAAKVMPLQALDANGSGSVNDVAAAFNYAGQNGVRIVNASLGAATTSQTLEQSIADNPNTLYVVAAGQQAGRTTTIRAPPSIPAICPEANLICVGATDQSDRPASFTNYGRRERRPVRAGGQHRLHLDGRPVRLRQRHLDGHADGERDARAHAGAADPSLTAAQLKADLLASVNPAPQLAGLSVTGGALNAAAAVAAVTPRGHARAAARAFPISGDRRARTGAGRPDPTRAVVAAGCGQPHPCRRPQRQWRPGPRVHSVRRQARVQISFSGPAHGAVGGRRCACGSR